MAVLAANFSVSGEFEHPPNTTASITVVINDTRNMDRFIFTIILILAGKDLYSPWFYW